MADEYDPVEAVCNDLIANIHHAVGKANLQRAMEWLEANMDADKWVDRDVALAREVIAFLRTLPGKHAMADLNQLGNQLSNPAIVLLEQRLIDLPSLVRAAENFLSPLTLQAVLEKCLIEPWENGLNAANH